VRAVIDEGFDPWWFGGDELAARQSYARRVHDDPLAMCAFEVQLVAIHEAWVDTRVYSMAACCTLSPPDRAHAGGGDLRNDRAVMSVL
jgi:hypothetical protein